MIQEGFVVLFDALVVSLLVCFFVCVSVFVCLFVCVSVVEMRMFEDVLEHLTDEGVSSGEGHFKEVVDGAVVGHERGA